MIDEFRGRGGVVGGHFEGKKLLLLHTVGRRSGKEYVTPLVTAAADSDGYVVCGSLGGGPKDLEWVANLEAAPGPVTMEIGEATVSADSTVVRPGDAGWQRLYGIWRECWPDAAECETKTERRFPVALLRPRS